MMMLEHDITVGLFDKDSKRQEIETSAARQIVVNLIANADMCATIFSEGVYGIYKHDNGDVVKEPSIRIEIAGVERKDILHLIHSIRRALNQESVMYKMTESHIDFVDATFND